MAYSVVNRPYRVERLLDSQLKPFDILEAVAGLDRPFMLSGGRYSYIGAEPFAILTATPKETELKWMGRRVTETFTHTKDPFTVLSRLMQEFRLDGDQDNASPFPFSSGAVGYFSYDIKNLMQDEGFTPYLKDYRGDGRLLSDLPLASLGFYNTIYVYDHKDKAAYLLTTDMGKDIQPAAAFIDGLHSAAPCAESNPLASHSEGTYSSSIDETAYIAAIDKALEYIAEGDIYQINISRRLSFPFPADQSPSRIYRRIKESAPSRFSYYMDIGEFQIIANTPERLLEVKGRSLKTEPIKGTRRRGKTEEEDSVMVDELRTSAKESAEHLMVVDLERNDIGRISKTASVRVMDFKRIETYPNLHHMVSTITGELKDDLSSDLSSGLSSIDALRKIFPGGSITGTPKVRAVELIDELEAEPRGLYTGTLGWMDFNGTLDMAMSIRTAVCLNDLIHLNVGSGIVADSDPVAEYVETTTKAEDFLKTLGLKASPIGGSL